jgi:hypothetical protein
VDTVRDKIKSKLLKYRLYWLKLLQISDFASLIFIIWLLASSTLVFLQKVDSLTFIISPWPLNFSLFTKDWPSPSDFDKVNAHVKNDSHMLTWNVRHCTHACWLGQNHSGGDRWFAQWAKSRVQNPKIMKVRN